MNQQKNRLSIAGLTVTYAAVLILIGLIAVGNYLLMHTQVTRHESNVFIVNMTGRLRASATQAGMLSRQLLQTTDRELQQDIRTSLQDISQFMQKTHQSILTGQFSQTHNKAPSSELERLFYQPPTLFDVRMTNYITEINALVKEPVDALNKENLHYNYIRKTLITGELLKSLDEIVYQFQKETSSSFKKLSYYNLFTFITTVIALVGAGYFVFRPMVTQVKHHTEALTSMTQRLDDELQAKNDVVQELEKSQKRQKLFVATLTHDLKTPVRAEYNLLKLMKEGDFGLVNDEQQSILEELMKSNRYKFHMIENILTTYKVLDDQFRLRRELTDLNEFALSVVSDDLKLLAQQRHQELILELDDSQSFTVEVDPVEMQRVLTNLIQNAISYTPKRSTIIVQTKLSHNQAQISVTDNGPGIPEDKLQTLFDPYTTAKKYKHVGSGLGLYVCKQIVEAHGGDIHVDTEEGKGCSFQICLPIVTPLVASSIKASGSIEKQV